MYVHTRDKYILTVWVLSYTYKCISDCMKGHRAKEGNVRVCTEVSRDVNKVFDEYERVTSRKVNKSLVMKKALLAEYEKVKEELNSLKKEI